MLGYASARPILGDMDRPERERRALHLAAADGMADIVGMLLDCGYDVNARDIFEQTALHLAASHNHPSVVRRLLETPNINALAKDRYRFTPLHAAAQAGSAEAVSLLLDNTNIHLNWETAHGATALWLATEGEHDEVAERLLQEPSIEVNAVEKDITLGRSTSLHHAVKNKSLRIVSQLLQKSSLNPNLLDYATRTPLCWAAGAGDDQMVVWLLERGDLLLNAVAETGQSPLWLAVQGNHLETVKRLLQAPAIDVNNGWADQTPLLKALKCAHLDVSHMLLEHERLDINARDGQGHSALTWSVCAGWNEIVQKILQRTDVEVNEAAE
ncbi:ankyrin repeat domain-containing protein [Aspergillus melleus]|uniref:ankyrin repeat domain-containing protein n=1 Tax=Aspergillus melleus TaxID=138277 RepID=UPI001E8CF867|nr:uncharacterized protein LDX57_008673 [Aspergillus melleus]KAH8431012.1 hypothetical protein LDX57_008673 [Aspergillus melleus]